ncbi:MAG: TatD family hydrolase [Desulfuromonadaceae bacterium]|nr:TatD family hydrolase [Desulfuromonadaceae bacterium]
MSGRLIDTHCHLDLEPLLSGLPRHLHEASEAGVQQFIVPGVHPDGWAGIAKLAAANSSILPAYGIHPMHAECMTAHVLGTLRERAAGAVAIGEIGIDPAYPVSMWQQEQALREQIRIAVNCGLPLLIHCRRAFQRILTVLHEERAGQVGGIMHAYSGSAEMAQEFIRLGFALSLSGTLTWNNAVRPLRVVRNVALEHLVLETDAPDMTPQKYRGSFNRPAWLKETAQRTAELKGVPLSEVARITTDNVRRILRLENCPA